jgi:hypothetical protein
MDILFMASYFSIPVFFFLIHPLLGEIVGQFGLIYQGRMRLEAKGPKWKNRRNEWFIQTLDGIPIFPFKKNILGVIESFHKGPFDISKFKEVITSFLFYNA